VRRYRIVLVDDHPVLRDALRVLLNGEDDMEVCGESDDPQRARGAIAAAKPDLVIVDLSFKEGSGLNLLKSLKNSSPDTSLLVLSVHDENLYAERAIRAGARGYVMKSEASGSILAAIRQIMGGKIHVSPGVAELFTERFVMGRLPADGSPVEQLSDRELQVFSLLGQGHDTRRIAEELHLSVKTVHAHRARIKAKLNVATGKELLREAVYWYESSGAG
jgi:DNA-binding NarL/FixJ family response regulator